MPSTDPLPKAFSRSIKRSYAAGEGARLALLALDPRMHVLYDHFLGDLIQDEYAAAKTNGISAASSVASSRLTHVTGTDDNGYAGNGFGLFWKGDLGVFMETMAVLPAAITTLKFEAGLSDAHDDAGAVNAKATPTATATDFGVLIFDTDDNTEFDFITQKASGVAAAKENILTLAANQVLKMGFRAQNDVIEALVNDVVKGGFGPIEGGSLLTPWLFAQARAGSASRTMLWEYLFVIGGSAVAT